MNNKICIMIGEDDCIFSCDEGVNFIPDVGEYLFINKEWYKVTERTFRYESMNVMKFCTAYIYVKGEQSETTD